MNFELFSRALVSFVNKRTRRPEIVHHGAIRSNDLLLCILRSQTFSNLFWLWGRLLQTCSFGDSVFEESLFNDVFVQSALTRISKGHEGFSFSGTKGIYFERAGKNLLDLYGESVLE